MTESFWVDDINVLFQNFQIVPTENDSRASALNKLTRLVLIISAIVSIYNVTAGLIIVIVLLLTIISIYYGQNTATPSIHIQPSHKTALREHFSSHHTPQSHYPNTTIDTLKSISNQPLTRSEVNNAFTNSTLLYRTDFKQSINNSLKPQSTFHNLRPIGLGSLGSYN